jgi:hypothetical protein
MNHLSDRQKVILLSLLAVVLFLTVLVLAREIFREKTPERIASGNVFCNVFAKHQHSFAKADSEKELKSILEEQDIGAWFVEKILDLIAEDMVTGSSYNVMIARNAFGEVEGLELNAENRTPLAIQLIPYPVKTYCRVPERTILIRKSLNFNGDFIDINRSSMEKALIEKIEAILIHKYNLLNLNDCRNLEVAYEEHLYEDGVKEIGSIQALWLRRRSGDGLWINFRDEMCDENGVILETLFWKSPIKYSWVSSKFNPRRFHPILKRTQAHVGTDFAAPEGTPIHSVSDGTIRKMSRDNQRGNFIWIDHSGGLETEYLHMSKFAENMEVNKRVTKGQIIGYVGKTGLATGPHVCFRLKINNEYKDVFKQDVGKKIKSEDMTLFLDKRSEMLRIIE